jgi:AsmA protein
MSKVLKWFMIAGIAAVIIGAAAAAYVKSRFEPERLKRDLAGVVMKQTGRTLKIAGDMELTFFPSFGVRLYDATLSNPDGFDDDPMLRVGMADVSVDIMPLLSKQIEMGDVTLQDVTFRLLIDKNGRSNLEGLAGKDEPDDKGVEGESGATYSFRAKSLEASGLRFVLDNRQDGRSLDLSDIDLSATPVELGKPMKVRTSLGVALSDPGLEADASLRCTAVLKPFEDTYYLKDISGNGNLSGAILKDGAVELGLQADSLDVHPQARRLVFGNLGLEASGESPLVPSNDLSGSLFVEKGSIGFADEVLKFTNYRLAAYGAQLTGSVELDGFASAPVGKAVIRLAQCTPVQVFRNLGLELPPMSGPDALSEAEGELTVDLKKDTVDIKKAMLVVDGQSIEGKATMAGFEKPEYIIDISADSLNLDPYLPPRGKAPRPADEASVTQADTEAAKSGSGAGNATDSSTTTATEAGIDAANATDAVSNATAGQEAKADAGSAKPAEAAADEGIIPVKMLRDLRLSADLEAGTLQARGVRFDNFSARIRARDGVVWLKPLKFESYGGKVVAAAVADVQQASPHSGMAVHVDDIQADPLAKGFAGRDDIAGNIDFAGHVHTHGNTVPAMLRGMNGAFKFDVQDGVFPGVDLKGITEKTEKQKDKGGTIRATKDSRTKFGAVTGSGVIEDGVLFNPDLSIKAPGLRAVGDGSVNLYDGDLGYLVKAKLVASSKGQGGESYEDLTGIAVPVRLGGTIANPSWFVDVTQYLQILSGAVVGTVGDVISGVGDILTLGGLSRYQEKEKMKEIKALRVDVDPQKVIDRLEAEF